ncbi:MAG: endonuclease MutS2 [Candidatus Zixiibacteriota bacterium]
MYYIRHAMSALIANDHTLTTLEFDKIVRATTALCLTPMGAEVLAERRPISDVELLDRWREESAEMLTVLRTGDGFPIVRVPDIRAHVERSGLEGSFLDPHGFLELGDFLRAVEDLLKFFKVSADAFPRLEAHLEGLSAVYQLRIAIERAITPEGEVHDQASPELSRIRREKRGARDAVVTRLERILRQRDTDPSRMDDLITLRNDRFVIPMREGDPAANDGVIQDRSSSGATLFVEPMNVVELNNRLRRLAMEESREVERILREMTDLIRDNRRALIDDVAIYGALDAIHAIARFGVDTGGTVAARDDAPQLDLVDARHPLLILKARELQRRPGSELMKVVPMSIALGKAITTVMITGPNTGGKTVALKTIGLLALMSQAGWPIPARENSRMGVFHHLLADIGDEQSIESSLSTFSSHLGRIRAALAEANNSSLVLLDELGAGTDPKEGSALGEAIVSALTRRGSRLVVTTHHTALKTLAQHDQRIENAAVLFDPRTLSPTYEFRIGLPGASYAIDIARRLGLPKEVTDHADSLVDQQEKDLSQLLLELDDRLRTVREKQEELENSTRAAAALEDLFRARLAKLEQLEKEKKSEALAQAEAIVHNTRQEMERLVREIRETQAERQRIKESQKVISEKIETIQKEKQRVAPLPAPKKAAGPVGVGDRVWIESFRREGEILTIDEGRDQVRVQIGDFIYTMDLTAVEPLAKTASGDAAKSEAARKHKYTGYVEQTSDVGPEVSLRGLSAEDALEMLDRYLDEALLAGWQEVRIVHGKGEGILRRAVGEFLTKDRRVTEKRLGHWNEGGDGVTLAKLRHD